MEVDVDAPVARIVEGELHKNTEIVPVDDAVTALTEIVLVVMAVLAGIRESWMELVVGETTTC